MSRRGLWTRKGGNLQKSLGGTRQDFPAVVVQEFGRRLLGGTASSLVSRIDAAAGQGERVDAGQSQHRTDESRRWSRADQRALWTDKWAGWK